MVKFLPLLSGLLLGAVAPGAVQAQTRPISYAVAFKGQTLATQTVSIVEADGLTTVTAAFEIEMPVFIARHRYAESLSATFRSDGSAVRLAAVRDDNSDRTEVRGELQDDGLLQVVRSDRSGVTTNFLAREEYDFHSLILYGTPPAGFLTTNRPARVLSIGEGQVVPVDIHTITESETFERQHLVSIHLVWTAGSHVSHSWHPERFSNLPRRYLRSTANGEFLFTLLR
jgi:hypothetical protein